MPQQYDLFPRDLDLGSIQGRAQAQALRLRARERRPGRSRAAVGGCPDDVARAHLDALRKLLGEHPGHRPQGTDSIT